MNLSFHCQIFEILTQPNLSQYLILGLFAFLSFNLSKIQNLSKNVLKNQRFYQYLQKNLLVQIIFPIFGQRYEFCPPPPAHTAFLKIIYP